MLRTILWAGFGLTWLAFLGSLPFGIANVRVTRGIGLWILGAMAVTHLAMLLLLWAGKANGVRRLYPALSLIIVAMVQYFSGGLIGLGMSGYVVVTILAVLLLGARGGANYFVGSALVSVGVMALQDANLLPTPIIAATPLTAWVSQAVVFIWSILLVYQLHLNHRSALKLARANQDALSDSVAELQATRLDLERHAAAAERRVTQLQVAAEVAREAANLNETDKLLARAVQLVQERFGFYHAGIFMVDDRRVYAVLRAATGEAGQLMLAEKHRLKIGETGIVGYVTRSGLPRIALDVGVDATYFQNPYLPETRSEMALPLKAGSQIIGALDVQSREESAFSGDDIMVLQTVADQLAVAIQNARLYEAARRQVNELTILHAVATAGAEMTSQDTLIERATQLIGESLYPDQFGILLVDNNAGVLRFHASYHGLEETHKQVPIPLGRGISGQVAASGRAIRASDVTRELGYTDLHTGMRSELCVPLKIGDRIIGVINAESSTVNDFTDADERLLSTFAGQLSTAIEKVHLFEAEQRRAAELEALRQASLHLTSNLEQQPVLEAILIHAVELIHADAAHLFLYNGETLTFGTALQSDAQKGYTIVRSDERPFGVPRPHGLTHTVASSGQRMVIPDVRGHPLFADRPWDGAIIGLPLRKGEQVLGVMNVTFEGSPHHFDENELRILELLADQAAIALVNARLYTESQERAAILAETLRQREALARLQAEFVQNVSHELRTPLAIIRGYIEMLNSGELGHLPSEQAGALSIVTRRVVLLSKLVDDLTAILETEAREAKREPVHLPELARKAVEDFETAARQASVILSLELPDNLPPVMGNGAHLYRVLDNLIGNAIKFTPAGGSVTMRLFDDGEMNVVEVADTGVGIPPEQLGRIFERFYQVDGSTTRRYGGTGLGLALVKEITTAHEGTVDVSSTPGAGSIFTVRLPRNS